MTVGEKIKYYRNIRGISQEMLGNLSGINPATTNALGISINLFMDFDIETVSDVLSLLFKLDEQVDMKFEAERDENGEFIPSTVKFSFQNAAINKKLCTYLKAKQIKENLENTKEKFDDENSYKETVAEIDENIEEIKNHLVDDNMIVKKGTAGITVKLYSED